MVFSSLTFLFAYLPAVLAVYYAVKPEWRNPVLFLASLFFYGWGEPVYILVMLFSIIVNYLAAAGIFRFRNTDKSRAKRILLLCIVVNIAILGFFKYWDFIAGNLNALGIKAIRPLRLGLPIGISFYTFQAMSYPIDVWQGKTEPQKDMVSFGAYVTMFPQLIAGPIVRYTDIAAQLNKRKENQDQFTRGICRFTAGLSKKVLLANNAGRIWESVSSLPLSEISTLTAWTGIIAFAFQIYFDFSGYSDMAIGLGKMFGFDFPENFNYPYISRSITEFWRRWHMSLSYWFRDYVYIPLGGNRKGIRRQILNILIVWILTGFWHGASWNFVLWGLMYGIILIFEKVFLLKKLAKCPGWICRLYTMVIVLTTWVLFAFTDIGAGLSYLKLMFFGAARFTDGLAVYYLRNNILLFVLCIASSIPVAESLCSFLRKQKLDIVYPLLVLGALFLCTAFITDASYNPFLYFRF
ncbi:MAG: MBOAT family protein [Solobacterium sp.]|nr:MBOAT family protein [Solobacterium sp.]